MKGTIPMLEFKLYVVQNSPKTAMVIEKLIEILNEAFGNQYALKVTDVFDDTDMTERDEILATPTLIKSSPEPVKRVIGDLRNKEKVFFGLGLSVAP